jgi:hypothetical protein
VQQVPPQPSELPHALAPQLGVQTQLPLSQVPGASSDVKQAVPSGVATQALPQEFAVWQAELLQNTPRQPEPEQQVPPQPSSAPQATPLHADVQTDKSAPPSDMSRVEASQTALMS